MSTAAQIVANRANSQHSTGPASEAGKSRSSLNAVNTGLTGRTVLLPSEDVELYARHIAGFFESYKPVGEEETVLVQSLADTSWRIQRVPALEAGIYALGRMELKDLFPQESDPGVRRHLIEAQIYLNYTRQLNNLLLQESRLRRQEEKDRKRLTDLQAERIQQRNRRLNTTAREYLTSIETGTEEDFAAKPRPLGSNSQTTRSTLAPNACSRTPRPPGLRSPPLRRARPAKARPEQLPILRQMSLCRCPATPTAVTNWRKLLCLPLALGLLCLEGCYGPAPSEAEKHAEANSAAGKLGKAAHAVAVQTGRAAHAVGKDLGKAARDAHAGWQEAAQKQKDQKH